GGWYEISLITTFACTDQTTNDTATRRIIKPPALKLLVQLRTLWLQNCDTRIRTLMTWPSPRHSKIRHPKPPFVTKIESLATTPFTRSRFARFSRAEYPEESSKVWRSPSSAARTCQ